MADELLTQPVTASPREHVNKAIGLLEKSKAYELFIVEKNELQGIVTIRNILKVSNITTERISALATHIPHVLRNDTISKVASIMTEHRTRTVPVLENGRLLGQVAASSICDNLSRRGKLNLTAATIMTPNPVSLQENDTVAKARSLMIQRNIDHVPVLGGQAIVGIVTSDAMVFRMRPAERIAPDSIVAERQRRLDSEVSGLMLKDPVISAPEMDVSQVIQQLKTRGTTYSLVALWDELQGIITYRDCVKLVSEPREETLPISVVGLPDDPFEAEAAKSKFERVVTRLARSLPDLLEARSVIKTSRRAGNRNRYEVTVDLITSRKTMSYSLSGWSLPEVYDELSDRMKRVTTKKRSPRKERAE